LRERREDEAKRELAGAIAEHFRAEEELHAAERRIAHAREAHLDAALTHRSATDLLAHQAYLERTESAREASQIHLSQREDELGESRRALSRAARDRQALERLKERRRTEFMVEAARIESLMLDEIAINNFRRSAA
jgi:flagellar FliJ protein